MATTPDSTETQSFNKASHTVSAVDATLITPSDDTDIQPTRGILIGVAGNLEVTMVGGTHLVLPVPAGYNPLQVKRIWAADTTATGIVALY